VTSNLLEALRDHLVAAGVVRPPRAPGALPPMWLDPRAGAPAPGEGDAADAAAVLAAFPTGGIPARPYESFLRTDGIDVWIRAVSGPVALDLEAQLRGELVDRRDFDLATMRIVECREWRPMQRLGSDAQAYTYVCSYLFQRYARP